MERSDSPSPAALTPIAAATAQPPLRGDRLLRGLEAAFARIDGVVSALPAALNPLAQTGAVANATLIIALVTGIPLLFWYSASVSHAHASLEAMRGSVVPQLVRSLHRYSSDACLLFVVIHAVRSVSLRQVAGPRRLAWVTGVVMVGLLWLVGWLGYWLVWDQRAQEIAVGTARLVDALPIISDPLGRSFLTDGGVNSLLFFMVFFFHMLLPLGIGIALWLHIARVSRPRFLPGLRLAAWILATLIVLSLIVPATSAAPAHMAEAPRAFTMDWWFLLPLAVTDRLGGGSLWLIGAVIAAVTLSAPWWLVRRGRAARRRAVPAVVDPQKCNACRQCIEDCPYGAIALVPRSDGKPFTGQAEVIPSKCVGCGVCAGSCNSAGIGLPWLGAVDQRHTIDGWLREETDRRHVAFLCAESAAHGLDHDPVSGTSSALPGYRVVGVPCVGWVHTLTIERALRRGAGGVLLVGCGTSCCYREGVNLAEERLAGGRGHPLDPDDRRVALVSYEPGRQGELVAAARRHRDAIEAARRARARWRVAATGLATIIVLSALTYLPSELGHATAASGAPELVVSFKHPGQIAERCRTLSEAEVAAKPAHMRQPVECARSRSPVRMRVEVDGVAVSDREYRPSGLFEDGISVAIARFRVAAGEHRVRIEISDNLDATPPHAGEQTLTFEPYLRRVVLFDKVTGFTWP